MIDKLGELGELGGNKMSSKLGRVVAAAGLATLLAPSAAYASWWDGGYQPAKREQPPPQQPPRRPPPPQTPPSTQPPPEQQPPQQPPPAEQPPPPQGQQPAPAQPAPAQPAPAPAQPTPTPAPSPAAPPPGSLPSIYGCNNTDLPGTTQMLQKTTTPPPGTPVAPGQEIVVEVTWRPTDWVSPELHKALDCVYINNRYAPELSGGERPTANDGRFSYSYVVPADVPPGSTICDQGFVSGPNGAEDYAREVSNVVCFPVGPPPGPPTPPSPPPGETTTATTTVTAPTTTTTEGPATEAERFSRQMPPRPAAAPGPAPLPEGQVLPRTGGDPTPGRLAAAALGVAAVLGRGRRRTNRRSGRRS